MSCGIITLPNTMEKHLNQGHSSDLISLIVPNPKYQELMSIYETTTV